MYDCDRLLKFGCFYICSHFNDLKDYYECMCVTAVTTVDSGQSALEFLGLGDDHNVVNVSR